VNRSNTRHPRARLLEKRCGGLGNRAGTYRRFQIPVQVLVGVEFRHVRLQVKQLDLLDVFRLSFAD